MGNKFKGSNFFSGINKPSIPEYIGIMNYMVVVPRGVALDWDIALVAGILSPDWWLPHDKG